MLAQWCFTAWNIAITRPNCCRSLAYAVARSTHSCAPPAASADTSTRATSWASAAAPREHAIGRDLHAVRVHDAAATGRVEVRVHRDAQPGRIGIDDDHVRTGDEYELIGEARAEHDTAVTAQRLAFQRQVADRARARRGGCRRPARAGARALLRGGAGHRDHGRREHGGQERPGRGGTAELLEHDHELGQAVAAAADVLGEVQAEPAEIDEVRPELRQLLGRGVEQVACRAACPGLLEEGARDAFEFTVGVGECDGHARTVSREPAWHTLRSC